jgi:nicotinate-nucleotide adenylyltransferase
MRLALFGGTFDPIHCAHLRVARAAADAFALDRVLFAPTGRQPLKSEAPAASFEDRLAMAALALAHPCAGHAPDPRFALTALDRPRPDSLPNYTVDLLEELAREHPDATLFAITGADSFLTLRQWRSPDRLLALAEWIVVSRTDFPLTPAFLHRSEFALTPAQRARIHLLPGIHDDISATDLRAQLHAPASQTDHILEQSLPSAVAAYIRDHHLYRS